MNDVSKQLRTNADFVLGGTGMPPGAAIAGALQMGADEIDRLTRELGEYRRAAGVDNPQGDASHYAHPEHGWTCFHCGETFHVQGAARRHFGNVGTTARCAAMKEQLRQLRWRPVNEKPAEPGQYLVRYKIYSGSGWAVAQDTYDDPFDNGSDRWYSQDAKDLPPITHWMPLPAAPNEAGK